MITGTGDNGQMLGIDNIPGLQSVEAASGDIPGLTTALVSPLYLISSTRFEPPEVCVMRPVRHAWLCSLFDSEHRLLLLPYANDASNIAAALQKVASERIVGQIMVLPIALDPSVTTVDGSDGVYVARSSYLVLWESPFHVASPAGSQSTQSDGHPPSLELQRVHRRPVRVPPSNSDRPPTD